MEELLFSAGIPGVSFDQRHRSERFEMGMVHAHAFWELYYLLAGECVYFIEGKSYPLRAGAFVFIGTNCLHRTVADTHERILIELDPACIQAFGPRVAMLAENRSLAVQFNEQEKAHVEAFLQCIVGCLREKPEEYAAKVRLYLFCLLCYVSDHARSAQAAMQAATPKHRQAERVIRYLEQHYAANLSLDDIAGALFTSKYHLSRVFKEVTGFTIVEYLTAVRLQHARALLASTDARVADIAGQAGFGSLAHFNRAFARQAGMPPVKYRRAFRGGGI